MTTRRYRYRGPSIEEVKLRTDPGLTLAAPGFVETFDATFDELVAPVATVDEAMSQFGLFPEPASTFAQAPAPYISFVSPDGSLWQITVTDQGVLSVTKIA